MSELQTSTKVFLFISLLAVGVVLGVYIYKIKGGNQWTPNQPANVQNTPNENQEAQTTYHPISAINDPELMGLNMNIRGYVAFKNDCFCPENAMCKPCDPLIVISEKNTALNSIAEAKESELVVTIKDSSLISNLKAGDDVKLEIIPTEIGLTGNPRKAILVSVK